MKRAAILLALLGGCTTLGPMASTTGISAVPTTRPGFQVSLAATPGYFLSSATTEKHNGAVIPSLAVLFEPDRWIGVPGLYISGRVMGTKDSGSLVEPMIGYRKTVDRMSLGIVFYGTQGSHENKGASYRALRVGGEVHGDVRITAPANFELHAVAGFMGTYLSAEGDYCLDAMMQYGRDCGEPPLPTTPAEASGFYPSVHVGLALDIAHRLESAFHGARLSLTGAMGTMPTVVGGQQEKAAGYVTVGLSLTVGFGAAN